eukprot:m.198949 g.198949  ORF g.198949 m.198949 type:complete len:77 (+) comp13691_c2_seq1:68-298(+)
MHSDAVQEGVVPAAFIHITENDLDKTVTFPVKSAIPCKNILVKLIRPEGEGTNIDARFIGFKGYFNTALMPFKEIL